MKPTLTVAKELLGKYIIRKTGNKKIIGKIVETEAYIGPADKASHAYNFKKTKRNKIEYLKGGRIYIYLVYGIYWQLNFTTAKKEKPECVLIRAIEPITKTSKTKKQKNKKTYQNLANGPGKLCQYLKLNKSFYGEDLTKSQKIWIEDWEEKNKPPHLIRMRAKGAKNNKSLLGVGVKPIQIKSAARVGIDYAGSYWSKKKWRFYLKNNEFVSKY